LTLPRIVTRLARMGVVSRARSASSTREVVVRLTPKGNAQVARLRSRDYEAVAIGGLSADEVAVLKNCLRRVYANMKKRVTAIAAE
jgi:DNA-binding MarR family transcriptional regulator